MADDDRLSAALRKAREDILKAENAGMDGDLDGVIYTHGLMTGTSRRLLAALGTVFAKHHPENGEPCCAECGFTWPCPTVRDITRVLTGEGDGG